MTYAFRGYDAGTASVGTVTSALGTPLAANPQRSYACFTNTSTTVAWLCPAGAAVASTGIPLAAASGTAAADGGVYEMAAAFGNLNTGAVTAITASGTATLAVFEGASTSGS